MDAKNKRKDYGASLSSISVIVFAIELIVCFVFGILNIEFTEGYSLLIALVAGFIFYALYVFMQVIAQIATNSNAMLDALAEIEANTREVKEDN